MWRRKPQTIKCWLTYDEALDEITTDIQLKYYKLQEAFATNDATIITTTAKAIAQYILQYLTSKSTKEFYNELAQHREHLAP